MRPAPRKSLADASGLCQGNRHVAAAIRCQYNAYRTPPQLAAAAHDERQESPVSSKQSAVAEPDVAVPEKEKKKKRKPKRTPPRKMPMYHVILWNDNDHSYDYVVEMMRKLFGYQQERGVQIAKEVDKTGKAVCVTTTLEHAELKRDQIHAYGPDKEIKRCKGSMSATIGAECA